MESKKYKELYAILIQNEPYPDFAESVCVGLGTETMKDEMLVFLSENPEASSVEILLKMLDLRGIKPIR